MREVLCNYTDNIEIIGASENNLKHIDLTIPKGKLVVLAGVSGSGKSSLAFDTIAVESARQWQTSYPLYLRNKMPHYERPKVDEIHNLTPAVVVDQKAIGVSSRSTVGTAVDVAPLIRLLFSRIGEPSAGGAMAYSFNHPLGMCPTCTGLGERMELAEESLFNLEGTLRKGGLNFSQFQSTWQNELYTGNPLLDPDKKLKYYSPEEWEILRSGSKEPLTIESPSNNIGHMWKMPYEGVIPRFHRLYLNRDISKLKKTLQEEILTHVRKSPCKTCGGTGLNPAALASKIKGRNIIDYFEMPVCDLLPVLAEIDNPVGVSLAKQIIAYLGRMVEVGIGYLSLSRRTDTLSGGEVQRIKMVRNLGNSLSNITYIFDEPTAGLHPADADRIGRLLVELRDSHNNVLVVEHSRQMMALADHIIELGPLAGMRGGEIVYQGDLEGLRHADTITAQAIRQKIKINPAPLPWTEGFEIKDAHCHNLKHIDVVIPKGVLTAVTGVAGSGKSSLVCHEFVKRCPEAIVIDQKPIGTSIRSTPATYTGVMDEIRKLFAKENGVGAEWFSFNSKGACPVCKGKGEISYEMAFAEPVVVLCEECQGRRYNPTALSYTYHGKNIEEVMMADIEAGLVSMVVVKDMSRFGRNYLEVGLYTEIRFPELGIRFIAVNDGVDSEDQLGNDFTPFRNIINEWYAKDTSKKIRAVFRNKGMSGQRLASKAPYGYIKGEDGQLLVDEETAPVVELIFQLCVEGNGPGKIARMLKEREIPTPGTIEFRRTGRTSRYYPDDPCRWNPATVLSILDQDTYLGRTTNFKTTKLSYKSKKAIINPPDKRAVFEGTHKAIIDRETWEIVQKNREQRRRPTKLGEMGLFSGLAYCADCGAKLYHHRTVTFTKEQESYTCANYRSRKQCTAHYIRAVVLEELVLQNLQRVVAYAQDDEDEFVRRVMENKTAAQRTEQERAKRKLEKQERRISELDRIIQQLYEDRVAGALSVERFTRLYEDYEKEQLDLKQSAEELRGVVAETEAQAVNIQNFLKIVRKYTEPTELTPALLREFVEKVVVHAPDKSSGHRTQRIDVHYNFIGEIDFSPEFSQYSKTTTA